MCQLGRDIPASWALDRKRRGHGRLARAETGPLARTIPIRTKGRAVAQWRHLQFVKLQAPDPLGKPMGPSSRMSIC